MKPISYYTASEWYKGWVNQLTGLILRHDNAISRHRVDVNSRCVRGGKYDQVTYYTGHDMHNWIIVLFKKKKDLLLLQVALK